MNLPWFKLSTNFDRDDRFLFVENEKGGLIAICCFFKLLCIAGRSNRGGAVYRSENVPHTAETLARQWCISLASTRKALQLLANAELIDVENGVIYISDWTSIQSTDKLEEIREYERERKQKYRKKCKEESKKMSRTIPENVPECPGVEIEKEIEKEKDIEKMEKEEDICETVKDFFNITTTAFPKIKFLSDKQESAIRDSINRFGFESVKYCFELAERSDFLKGKNKQGWMANFDWLINPDNLVKVLNGNYSSVYSPPPTDDGLETSFESHEFIEAALSRGFGD